MNKELFKLAKEKGFISILADELEIVKEYANVTKEDIYYIYLCELQRWLREEYDMFVLVYYDGILFDVGIYGRYTENEIRINSFISHEPTLYTYEEALEFGLIAALKLIENE